MAVISISITESTQQIIAGIPKSITLTANIPSTIFYTLDGTTPTTSSSIYLNSINLPTNNSSVLLKIFATNGVDVSAVIEQSFSPNMGAIRQPRDTVIGLSAGCDNEDKYPFGDNSPSLPVRYGKTGGITVDSPDIINIPDGYDGAGGISNGTDLPLSEYTFRYSTTNRKGETGHGIGTIPANTIIRVPQPTSPSSSSKTSDKFFNPKAMVIYQDSSEGQYDENVSQVNRANFSLQNITRDKDGALLLNTAFDSSTITGNFLRSHFNPRDNTITYYYRDSDTGRWIISKEAFTPKNSNIGALYKMVFSSRESGAGMIFKWIPFMSRKLI